MNKVAMYREAILNEALIKIAKEKKEKRPNRLNAGMMVYKESFKDYGKKERVQDFAKSMGGAAVGGAIGAAAGKNIGSKVTNKMLAKGNAAGGAIAGALTAHAVSNAGQIAGAVIAGKEGKKRQKAAEANATKRLSDKLYGNNERIKNIAMKEPKKFIGSYSANLIKAEKAYKKELKNK